MNDWYKIFLGNSEDALNPTSEIQEAIRIACMATGEISGMALFSEKDDHHNVTLYFSPALAEVAKEFPRTLPCPRPSASDRMTFLGPDPQSRQMLLKDL